MAKLQKEIKSQLEAVYTTVLEFPSGASAEEIKAALKLSIELRTLQRRLATLVEQEKISISGNARARQYFAIALTETNAKITAVATSSIPLTGEAKQILAAITQPVEKRKPVGYGFEMLNNYEPNVDFYLSTEERIQLHELGKTARKNEPAGTYAKEILNRLLIDLSYNSSRLEGNTYSLLDTERLIAGGITDNQKSAAEAQMILNHKEAIEFIVQSADEIGFNRYTITNLHALLSNNLLPNPAASGRLRNFAVGITGSVYTPLALPQQIESAFGLVLGKVAAIQDPFEQAFFVMVHLPYLQPFDDVNKRVSRLAANIPLNKHNLIPLSFTDVPADVYINGLLAVYELTQTALLKDVFLWAYQRSAERYKVLRQTLGEPDPFRLAYREQIRDAVAEMVSQNIPYSNIEQVIGKYAEMIPMKDKANFYDHVKIELNSLHEGNFARYRIRPSQFQEWKSGWRK